MQEIQTILDRMEPEEALTELAPALRKFLGHLDNEARVRYISALVGEQDEDKISSMVNLWLAECLDEGVDPTHMCQSLVHKVVQSKQLKAVADPGILALFEAWLDELEEEVTGFLKNHPGAGALDIASQLGLSKSGAAFLVAKLEREEKI